MDLSQFDYELPEELIAQQPPPERDGARMLVLHRESKTWEDRAFRDLPSFVGPDDLMVFNNSRVFKARLIGHRAGHTGRIEIFLAEQMGDFWRALVRPGRKLPPGTVVEFAPDFRAVIEERLEHGERRVRLEAPDVWAAIDAYGHMPLPPYIHRIDNSADGERYQTVLAKERGSVAAPTAGLHFTPAILERCAAAGASRGEVTLHVGLGTFQPLHSNVVEENALHFERYRVDAETAAKIRGAKRVADCRDNGHADCRVDVQVWRRGRDESLYLSGVHVSARQRDGDEFSLAAVESAAAGVRVRRNGVCAGCLSACRRAAVSLFQLRRLHADSVIISASWATLAARY